MHLWNIYAYDNNKKIKFLHIDFGIFMMTYLV